ncbi:MAG: neutral/alkaline non-lysosomal ceramidase N-terminal domain-containing protein, partial [Bdellovibrionia bacterium]
SPYRVGVAAVDITPPIGVPLAGYGGGGRRAAFLSRPGKYNTYLTPSEGILDPIYARAFYVEAGEKRLLFVSVDMIGASKKMRADILPKLTGFTDNEFFISGTHTHSGPGAFENNWLWSVIAADKFKQEVYDYLVAGIMNAIDKARATAQPANVFEYSFEPQGLQSNRRNRPGHFDPSANVIVARGFREEWIGGIVNFAIHGTILGGGNQKYSADVNGAIATKTEDIFALKNPRISPRPVFLFVNGAEGDVAPSRTWPMGEMGERFATDAMKFSFRARALKPQWKVKQAIVDLGSPKVGKCTKTNVGWFFLQALDPLLLTAFPTEARVWSLAWDDLRIGTLPGEGTTDIGYAMKKHAFESGARQAMVFGLTNDHLSYLVTPSEYWEGDYEACSSFYGPDGGVKIVEQYKNML